jgi:Protein of unknown function (DUF1580)
VVSETYCGEKTMVDIATEQVFALAEIHKHVPKRRGGRKIHTATGYRWASRGLNGVRLEVVQVGGTKCTSLEALQRFFERLSAVASGEAPPVRTAKQRERAAAKANDELQKAGW